MREGVVKQFSQTGRYGFIKDQTNGKSYFVFYTAIQNKGVNTLLSGQKVKYQLAQGKKGLQCVNLYLVTTEKKEK